MQQQFPNLTHKKWSLIRVWLTRRSSWEEETKHNHMAHIYKLKITIKWKEREKKADLDGDNFLSSVHVLSFVWSKLSKLSLTKLKRGKLKKERKIKRKQKQGWIWNVINIKTGETWMDWAIWVMNWGGSFKSLTVLLANTTTSESGSFFFPQLFILIIKN